MPKGAGKKNGGGLGRTGKPRSGKAPPKDMMLGSSKSGARKSSKKPAASASKRRTVKK